MSTRRSKQEIVAELDAKIAYHEDCITKLKARREVVAKPAERVRKTSMKKAMDAIKEAGLTPDEIMVAVMKAAKKNRKAEQ